jgi:hypothetical protein
MTVAKRAVEFISVLRAHRPTSTKGAYEFTSF